MPPDSAPLWAAEVVMFFEQEDWDAGLPQPAKFRLVAGPQVPNKRELRVFDLASYKGLEADTVILVVGGHLPINTQEIYVGVSRARFALALVDCGRTLDLPPELLGLTSQMRSKE